MSKKDNNAKMQRIRAELWETFGPEMEELTENLEQQLLSLENDHGNLDLVAALFRTMHTLKGSCGMMGLTKIEELTHQAEDVMDLVREQKLELNSELVDLLFDTLDTLKAGQSLILKTKTDEAMEVSQSLLDGLRSFKTPQQTETAQTDESNSDNDLWFQLAQETIEQLDDAESLCLNLECQANDKQCIDALFRNFHTAKGSFNLAGLEEATRLMHAAEDLIGCCRDSHDLLKQPTIDALLSVIDLIRTHLQKNIKTRCDIDAQSPQHEEVTQKLQQQHADITNSSPNVPIEAKPQECLTIASGDGHIEIDSEYLKIFFDIVWRNLNEIKTQLQKNDPSSADIAQSAIQESIDSILLAAEQLKLSQVNAALTRFEKHLKENSGSLENLSGEANTLWHFFWELEETLSEQVNLNALPAAEPKAEAASIRFETISADHFFDGLWPQLSKLRKILEQENGAHVVEEIREQLAHVKAMCDPVENFSISEPLQALERFLETLPSEGATDSVIGTYIQEIYTICWDHEDQLSGQEIQLRRHADQSIAGQTLPPDSAPSTPTPTQTISQVPATASPQPSLWVVDNSQASLEPSDVLLSHEQDPMFALDFLTNAQTEMGELQRFKNDWKNDNPQAPELIKNHLKQLANSANLIGFGAISQLADEFLAKQDSTNWVFHEATCRELELGLFSILTKIEESVPPEVKKRHHVELTIGHVFKHWHAEHFTHTLAQSILELQALEGYLNQWRNGNGDEQSIEQSVYKLQQQVSLLLLTCQYHHLDDIEDILLDIDDMLVRSNYDKALLSQESTQSIGKFLNCLGQVIAQVNDTGVYNGVALNAAYQDLAALVKKPSNEPRILSTKTYVDTLPLPTCIKEVITEQVLDQINGALAKHQQLFMLFVDVEHDETLAERTFTLLDSGIFETIINATDYHQGRSVFHFLVASGQDQGTLESEVKAIDGSSTFLKINRLNATQNSNNLQPPFTHASRGNEQTDVFNLPSLNKNIEHLHATVGELISVKANLAQVSQSVSDFDLFNFIDHEMRQCHGDWQTAKHKVRTHIQRYDEDLTDLIKAQEDVDSILDKLQTGVSSLKQAPINTLFQSIESWYRQSYGDSPKLPLVITQSDVNVERETIHGLLSPLRRLIALLQAEGKTSESAKIQLSALENTQGNYIELAMSNTLIPNETLQNWGIPSQASVSEQLKGMENSAPVPGSQLEQLWEISNSLAELALKLQPQQSTGGLHGFTVEIPSDNMIVDGITVMAGKCYYIVPIQLIERIINMEDTPELKASADNHQTMIKVGDEVVPLVSLNEKENTENNNATRRIVLIICYENEQCGIIVDELVGLQQILLTPLEGQMRRCKRFQGCAVLGKNRIGMVINPAALFLSA